jgi:hypothetical protein
MLQQSNSTLAISLNSSGVNFSPMVVMMFLNSSTCPAHTSCIHTRKSCLSHAVKTDRSDDQIHTGMSPMPLHHPEYSDYFAIGLRYSHTVTGNGGFLFFSFLFYSQLSTKDPIHIHVYMNVCKVLLNMEKSTKNKQCWYFQTYFPSSF